MIEQIQIKINQIKLPHFINRTNFYLNQRAKWKASEYGTFFFYCSLICLKDHLPRPYYWNLCCLIHGSIF